MEKVQKKYCQNNKKYYNKKKNNIEKSNSHIKNYDNLVNVRKNVDELDELIIKENNEDIRIMKIVAGAIVVLAIVFGSLLLFHCL